LISGQFLTNAEIPTPTSGWWRQESWSVQISVVCCCCTTNNCNYLTFCPTLSPQNWQYFATIIGTQRRGGRGGSRFIILPPCQTGFSTDNSNLNWGTHFQNFSGWVVFSAYKSTNKPTLLYNNKKLHFLEKGQKTPK
jgi:hypothetical protein